MSLTDIARRIDLRLYHAIRCAQGLADVMNRHYGGPYDISWDESEFDPRAYVSIEESPSAIKLAVDKMCDNLARAYLTALYPDFGFVGEESFDPGEMKKDFFWCVDPICGSMGYYKQTGFFGTSVALVDGNQGPLFGAVNCPALRIAGIASTPHHRLHLEGDFQEPETDGLKVAATANMDKRGLMKEVLTALSPAVLDFQESIPTKSLGVLYGTYDLNFGLPRREAGAVTKVWDMAASIALFKTAGKPLVDFDGAPLNVTGKSGRNFENGYIMAKDEGIVERFLKTYNEVIR